MTTASANNVTQRYQIIKKLGEGGMAVVYKAFDTNLERDVAIKIIKGEKIANGSVEQMIKRFEREVKTLAKLTHPNIVHIHDYGRYQKKPYLIMEYLPGGTLEDRILEGQIPFENAAEMIIPIAEALKYAHQQGVLHRDVKPANILFTEDGKSLLTDFGIAKILGTNTIDESEGNLTQTGMGLGTPEYMAPEQWHGKFSPQTDIYAIGVVFYEMITGRKPFIAETPAAFLIKQMMEAPPHPAEFVPDLPIAVSNFIFRALEKEEDNRYENMQDVIHELQRFASGKFSQVTAYQPPTTVENPPVSTMPAWKEKKANKTTEETERADQSESAVNGQKETAFRKIARGFGRVLQQLVITILIVAVVLSIIMVIGAMYVFGLFSRQAIQNSFYEDITREETYRMSEEVLNENLDNMLMPYFEDFADDIDAEISAPNILDFTIYRQESAYHLYILIENKDGYPQFSVESINDQPLLFVRGIMSNQINRGMRRVLDDNEVTITQLEISDNEINYTVTPLGE
jgi:serine/threonine protein kinase